MTNSYSQVLLQFFGMHPLVGFVTSMTFLIFGSFSHFLIDIHIPTIMMDCIQIVAWTLGGMASCYTMLGLNKKSKKK